MPKPELTEAKVHQLFLSAITNAGSQRKFAKIHGLTVSYINDMANKRRQLSDRILQSFGVVREVTVTYRFVDTLQPDSDE